MTIERIICCPRCSRRLEHVEFVYDKDRKYLGCNSCVHVPPYGEAIADLRNRVFDTAILNPCK